MPIERKSAARAIAGAAANRGTRSRSSRRAARRRAAAARTASSCAGRRRPAAAARAARSRRRRRRSRAAAPRARRRGRAAARGRARGVPRRNGGVLSPPKSSTRTVAVRPASGGQHGLERRAVGGLVGQAGASRNASSVRSRPTPSAPAARPARTSAAVAALTSTRTRTPSRVTAGSPRGGLGARALALAARAGRCGRRRRAPAAGASASVPAPPSTRERRTVGDGEQRRPEPDGHRHAEPARDDRGVRGRRRRRRARCPRRRRRARPRRRGRGRAATRITAARRVPRLARSAPPSRRRGRAAPERAHVVGARGQRLVGERRDQVGVHARRRRRARRRAGARRAARPPRARRRAPGRRPSARRSRRSRPRPRGRRRAAARRAPRAPRPRRRARCGRAAPAPPGARASASGGAGGDRRVETPGAPGRLAGRRRQALQQPLAHQPWGSRARPSAATISADEVAPGSWWPIGALAEVGRAALARLHRHRRAGALLRGGRGRGDRLAEVARRPRRPRAAPATAGSERVDHRLVAGLGRAELDHAGQRRVERVGERGPVERRRVADRPAGAAQGGPPQGPARAADLRDQRLARGDQLLAGRLVAASPALSTTARKPRVMLTPWSPSPIAESSCVRWLASASTAEATSLHPAGDVDGGGHGGLGAHGSRTPAERGGVDGSIPQRGRARRRARAPSATRRPSRAT